MVAAVAEQATNTVCKQRRLPQCEAKDVNAYPSLVFSLVLLQALDVWTTNQIPRMEANPVVLAAMSALGPSWWLIKLPPMAFVLVAFKTRKRFVGPLLCVVTAGYFLVVSDNLLNMARTGADRRTAVYVEPANSYTRTSRPPVIAPGGRVRPAY
jgi:hypothetical protein